MLPLGKITLQMLLKTEWRFLLFGFFMSFGPRWVRPFLSRSLVQKSVPIWG